jgi:hypothetical protein
MAKGRGLRGVGRALALRLGLLALGLSAMCLKTRAALAQDWEFDSSLSQRMSYNSNLLLSPNRAISAFGTQTTPELTLRRDSPSSQIALRGRFRFAEYFGHSDLNSQDQFVNLNMSKDLNPRSTLGFSGDFNRDTTLESDQDDTGRFLDRSIRFTTWDANPSWQYLLSPIDRLQWSGNYRSVDYSTTEKTDYQVYGTNVTYLHDLSELASVTGSLTYSRFEADNEQDLKTDVYGGLIGYEYHPTERFTVSGATGLTYNITHQNDQSDADGVGYRFQFNLNYDIDERTNATVTLSRDIEPSGDGREDTRNRGTVGLKYRLGELTTLTLDAGYTDSDKFGSTGQSTDGLKRLVSVSPGVSWKVTDDLSLRASYQFRYKHVESSGSAVDNAVFITLRYALPDLHWSGF